MSKTLAMMAAAVLCCAGAAMGDGLTVPVTGAGDGNTGKDRWGYSSWYDVPFTTDASPNYTGHWYESGDGQKRTTYLQVSLAGLPAADAVLSAELWIKILSLNGSGLIATVSHAADSSAATGNASDKIGGNQTLMQVTDGTGAGWLTIDVTDYLKADLAAGYGWAAFSVSPSSYRSMTFGSGESDTDAPYLKVTGIPEPLSLSLLGLGGAALIGRRR